MEPALSYDPSDKPSAAEAFEIATRFVTGQRQGLLIVISRSRAAQVISLCSFALLRDLTIPIQLLWHWHFPVSSEQQSYELGNRHQVIGRKSKIM
jgi:hypothetical protein